MNESITGVFLGLMAALGVTYVAVKMRQNQEHLRRLIGFVDQRHASEVSHLLDLADSGKLAQYNPAGL